MVTSKRFVRFFDEIGIENGTPLFVVQELAGWETEKMARRYAHLSPRRISRRTPRG